MKLREVYEEVERAQKRDGQTWPDDFRCPESCAKCCERSGDLTITLGEAREIAAVIEVTPARREQIANHVPKRDTSCCLLENGRCIAYEARPLICRAYGFSADDGNVYFGCEILAPKLEGKIVAMPSYSAARESMGDDERGYLSELLDRLLPHP